MRITVVEKSFLSPNRSSGVESSLLLSAGDERDDPVCAERESDRDRQDGAYCRAGAQPTPARAWNENGESRRIEFRLALIAIPGGAPTNSTADDLGDAIHGRELISAPQLPRVSDIEDEVAVDEFHLAIGADIEQ